MPREGQIPSENWVDGATPHVSVASQGHVTVGDQAHNVAEDFLVAEVSEFESAAGRDIRVESLSFEVDHPLQALRMNNEPSAFFFASMDLAADLLSFSLRILLFVSDHGILHFVPGDYALDFV